MILIISLVLLFIIFFVYLLKKRPKMIKWFLMVILINVLILRVSNSSLWFMVELILSLIFMSILSLRRPDKRKKCFAVMFFLAVILINISVLKFLGFYPLVLNLIFIFIFSLISIVIFLKNRPDKRKGCILSIIITVLILSLPFIPSINKKVSGKKDGIKNKNDMIVYVEDKYNIKVDVIGEDIGKYKRAPITGFFTDERAIDRIKLKNMEDDVKFWVEYDNGVITDFYEEEKLGSILSKYISDTYLKNNQFIKKSRIDSTTRANRYEGQEEITNFENMGIDEIKSMKYKDIKMYIRICEEENMAINESSKDWIYDIYMELFEFADEFNLYFRCVEEEVFDEIDPTSEIWKLYFYKYEKSKKKSKEEVLSEIQYY